MKTTILLSALLLCAVSLACSILLWVSMPADLWGKVLAGATATALEVCKFAFFPAGIYIFRNTRAGAIALWVLGVVLLAISVAATVGFLENAHGQHSQKLQQQSTAWKTKQQQLNSLDKQITTLNQLIAVDGDNSYRQRAYENAARVRILEQDRSEILNQLQNLQESPQGSAQSLFSAVGGALGVSAQRARHGAFTALALIVDLCGIAALLAVAGLPHRAPIETAKQRTRTAAHRRAVAHEKPKQPEPSSQTLLAHEQQLAQRILAGEFGQPPSVRSIVTEAKGGHATVNKIMQHLMSDNKVTREGQRYYLVQNIIN